MTMPSARMVGFLLAVAGLTWDQISKLWSLYVFEIDKVMQTEGPVAITPFFDLVLVWNHGISYGLFQQDSDLGRYALIGLALAASVLLSVWLWRTADRLLAAGLGMVLGGAIGNGIDRIVHGAVVDLFHFHWGDFSWYVFNLADVWIVIGAGLLIYDSLFGAKDKEANDGPKDAANE